MYDFDFNINYGAWSTILELDSNHASNYETVLYELEYDIENEIAKYKERAFFDFTLINNRYNLNFSSNVKIHFPSPVQNTEDINLWITRQECISDNGDFGDYKCYKDNSTVLLENISNDNLEFSFKGGTSECALKLLLPSYLFNEYATENYVGTFSEINSSEESIPDLQAFLKRKQIEKIMKIIIGSLAYYTILWYIPIKVIFKKYFKIFSELEKYKKKKKYKYYRDIDMNTMTPIKAWAMTNNEYIRIPSKDFENILTSTILYLRLNGFLEITKNLDKTFLTLTNKDINYLEPTEKEILKFVENIMEKECGNIERNELKIEISKIQEYIEKEKDTVIELNNYLEKHLLPSLHKLTKEKRYCSKYIELYEHYNDKFKKLGGYQYLVHLWAISVNCTVLCISDILGIISIITTILAMKKGIKGNMKKIEILNAKGIEEAEKYHGLKRYLNDYSIIKDREILEVELWEEYLMYATIFGVAKKTIKQMDLDYPDYESFFSLRY